MTSFFIYIPQIAQAACNPYAPAGDKLCNPTSVSDLLTLVLSVLQVFGVILGLATIIMMVFAGFRMILSRGESEELTKAKEAFAWPIYGMILTLFAFVIVYAVADYSGMRDIDTTWYNFGTGASRPEPVNPLVDDTFGDLLVRMIINFLKVAAIIAILMIILGSFRYIVSAGSSEQAEQGKKTIQWAVIGLIVSLLAYVIIRATATFFGG